MIDQGDGAEVVWETFWEQWTTNLDSAPQETPLNIFRLSIGHCKVNRGQHRRSQRLITEVDNHTSHINYPHSSQSDHANCCVFSRVRWNLVGGCSSYDVITSWPDLIWPFLPKVAQKMPYKPWKISARYSKRCGVQLRKTRGCFNPFPLARVMGLGMRGTLEVFGGRLEMNPRNRMRLFFTIEATLFRCFGAPRSLSGLWIPFKGIGIRGSCDVFGGRLEMDPRNGMRPFFTIGATLKSVFGAPRPWHLWSWIWPRRWPRRWKWFWFSWPPNFTWPIRLRLFWSKSVLDAECESEYDANFTGIINCRMTKAHSPPRYQPCLGYCHRNRQWNNRTHRTRGRNRASFPHKWAWFPNKHESEIYRFIKVMTSRHMFPFLIEYDSNTCQSCCK